MAEAMAATEDAAWRPLGPPVRVQRFEKGHRPGKVPGYSITRALSTAT
jgi:hypothetical protein